MFYLTALYNGPDFVEMGTLHRGDGIPEDVIQQQMLITLTRKVLGSKERKEKKKQWTAKKIQWKKMMKCGEVPEQD